MHLRSETSLLMLPTMKVDVNEISKKLASVAGTQASKKLVHKLVRRQKVYTDTSPVWYSELS